MVTEGERWLRIAELYLEPSQTFEFFAKIVNGYIGSECASALSCYYRLLVSIILVLGF